MKGCKQKTEKQTIKTSNEISRIDCCKLIDLSKNYCDFKHFNNPESDAKAEFKIHKT